MNGIEQLCLNCGLCCDGTLFADVELRAGDDAKRLAALGLALERKGRGKLAFAQPCACFDGTWCRIYGGRPNRCRSFECGLLKKVDASTMTVAAALARISEAKRLAEKVRELLRPSGQPDEQTSLTQRYIEAMSAPVDLADEAGVERRGKLMLAVNDLMRRLQQDFLQR